MYQNEATYLLAHEQLRFLSGDAFSLCSRKFRRVNSESTLKGMGDETLIGLLHVIPKTHPLLINRIGTTLLDHAPGASTVFPVIKLAKVDLDTL